MQSAAPTTESSALSVKSWRKIRRRPAPRETRSAISRSRTAARASIRFATFAQAISSTNATAASRSSRPGRSVLTSSSWKPITRIPFFWSKPILFLEFLLNGYHFGVGLGNGNAVFEPRENYQFVIFAVEQSAIKCKWFPQFEIGQRAVEREAVRQHPDDGERLFIEQNRLAEDSGIAAEAALPQAVTQQHDLLMADLFVFRCEIPADYRSDAQHSKEIPGYLRTP